MGSSIYFGNRLRQAYIPTPDVGMTWSNVKRSNLIALEGGGVYVDDSRASHREGQAEWAMQDPNAFRIVREFLDGVWGPGPFYWVDPFAADTNLLSPAWATPGIIADGDWPDIHSSTRASFTTITPNMLGLPNRTVTYSPTNAVDQADAKTFTLLIPPGHAIAFGCHGRVTGYGVVVLRGTKSTGEVTTKSYVPLDTFGIQSFNATDVFPYSEGYRLVDIYLARSDIAASSVTLSGMRAIAHREGEAPPKSNQPFVSGEGAGALRFVGGINETLNYAPRDQSRRSKGFSVRLAETGAWE